MKLWMLLTLIVAPGFGFAAESARALYQQGSGIFYSMNESREAKAEAWKLIDRAAELGDERAMMDAALFYAGVRRQEAVVKPDVEKAIKYFRVVAAHNRPEALLQLGLLFSSGLGQPKDASEAPQNLFLKAAEHGSTEAMIHLSDRFFYGFGVRQDLDAAVGWRVRAWRTQREAHDRNYYLDEAGDARPQTTPELTEFAERLAAEYRKRPQAAIREPNVR